MKYVLLDNWFTHRQHILLLLLLPITFFTYLPRHITINQRAPESTYHQTELNDSNSPGSGGIK